MVNLELMDSAKNTVDVCASFEQTKESKIDSVVYLVSHLFTENQGRKKGSGSVTSLFRSLLIEKTKSTVPHSIGLLEHCSRIIAQFGDLKVRGEE